MLLTAIRQPGIKRIFEIGCGNSPWLAYLARTCHVQIAGLDYSPDGCRLARENLASNNLTGTIYCADVFDPTLNTIGQFDFVYSLGVIEHFLPSTVILKRIGEFVRPGGYLLSEVPNLRSIHGIVTWLYQPKQLESHVLFTRRRLENIHSSIGLKVVDSGYIGVASLNLVAWGQNQRFPDLDRVLLPVVHKMNGLLNRILLSFAAHRGTSFFAPYLFVLAQRPPNESCAE